MSYGFSSRVTVAVAYLARYRNIDGTAYERLAHALKHVVHRAIADRSAIRANPQARDIGMVAQQNFPVMCQIPLNIRTQCIWHRESMRLHFIGIIEDKPGYLITNQEVAADQYLDKILVPDREIRAKGYQ